VITDAPRIVTRHLGRPESWTLRSYLAADGYQGLRKAVGMSREAVHEEITKASVLGRGGAGFPAGQKWSMLRKAEPVYLVVNGDESEPATFKDHVLIEQDPHQIVEGTLITAFAINAAQVFSYSVDVVVHPGAGAYICGDETGLLESLEGKRGFPRIKPPYFPAAFGLYQAPTVVNNVETMSNVPWIILNGSDAFAALGDGRSRGTRIFAVSGHVKRPGNYEVEMAKTTFRDLIYAPVYGGGIRGGRDLKAFIPGGASAYWLGPEQLDAPLDQDKIQQEYGTMLGSGSVVAMDDTTCMVRAAWRITRFFHKESCGQCTPCREGAGWLEKVLQRIEGGQGREADLDLLLDVCDNISPGLSWPPRQTTICPLGPSIPSAIVSAVRMFRDEFMVHIKEGACPYAR
jgi:NADH-quinone oxidoreductase subunit F